MTTTPDTLAAEFTRLARNARIAVTRQCRDPSDENVRTCDLADRELEAFFVRALTAQALPAAEPTRPANSQDWAGMDGATAYWLIERHAEGWADIALMMGEWLAANQAAQQAAQATAGWLPIETAPKDGTEIILRRGTRVGAGMWVKWPATEHEEAGEGWTIGFDGDSWDEEKAPTQWQPLPQPQPQSAQAKGDAA